MNSNIDLHSANASTPIAATTTLKPTRSEFARLGGRELRPFELRRVERLDARGPHFVSRAHHAGVEITYLGIAPLFAEARLYRGVDSDWVLAPIDKNEEAVVPMRQQPTLRRLDGEGLAFPLLYGAHQVDAKKTEELLGARVDGVPEILSRADAATLAGPIPPPATTVELGDRLGQQAAQILSAIGRGAPLGGKILLGAFAAPVLLAGAAIASIATVDPIIFGAIPALRDEIGEPAAFFELCRWDW